MNHERRGLVARSEEAIEELLEDYFLFEIDDNPVACVALHTHSEEGVGELAHLFVNPSHGNQGIGQKLVQFIEDKARENGLEKLVTLSTQSFAFFTNKLGYTEGSPNDLPAARRSTIKNGAETQVLIKTQLMGLPKKLRNSSWWHSSA